MSDQQDEINKELQEEIHHLERAVAYWRDAEGNLQKTAQNLLAQTYMQQREIERLRVIEAAARYLIQKEGQPVFIMAN